MTMCRSSVLAASLVVATGAGATTPPASFTITGVIRDFHERTHAQGHPDFERMPDHGFGLYTGNVALTLGSDRKPVFVGGGRQVWTQWQDASGQHNVAPHLFRPDLGDIAGSYRIRFGTMIHDNGGVTSPETFAQWFRDVPGLNISQSLEIVLERQADGTYVFDSSVVEPYASIGGFFPINGQLFGNSSAGEDRNYHFTFEFEAEFAYDASAGQIFTFVGDDDVYVFINDQLVIDLGGVHGVTSQSVLLDRLGLVDGQTYRMNFFFAERHRTQSNFRVQTNLELRAGRRYTFSVPYD